MADHYSRKDKMLSAAQSRLNGAPRDRNQEPSAPGSGWGESGPIVNRASDSNGHQDHPAIREPDQIADIDAERQSLQLDDQVGAVDRVEKSYSTYALGDDLFSGGISPAETPPGVTRASHQNATGSCHADTEAQVTCFAAGTLIHTGQGTVPIESLRAGDMVLTRDNGPQPVCWTGSRRYSTAELNAAPKLRPIRIRAGALGNSAPAADLIVSPQHRMLVRSRIAQRMFGIGEVLVCAGQLLEIDGIEIAEDMAEVEYWSFLFDRHEVILANGAETESLYPWPETLKSLEQDALEEIHGIIPQLRDDDFIPEAARQLVREPHGRELATRHVRHAVALVS